MFTHALIISALLAAAAADREPPVLDGVTVAPKRMAAGGSVHIRHRLSERATLVVRVHRLEPGHAVRLGASLAVAPPGRAETALSGTKLLPGRHRITVKAVDAAGNVSRRRTATFRVVG